jgi:hypothetical protein
VNRRAIETGGKRQMRALSVRQPLGLAHRERSQDGRAENVADGLSRPDIDLR